MLQVSYIREHQAEVIERLSKRTIEAHSLIESVLKVDEARRSLQTKVDVISFELNIISKEIGELFKSGQAQKANEFKQKTTDLKETKSTLSEELNTVTDSLQALLYKIPNLPNSIVPKGVTEDDNEEIFSAGTIPMLSDNSIPHWELGIKYDIIDFELGNKITGAGFPVYKGKGARLQRALINYFLDKNIAAGYNEIQVPHLVNEASALGTGQLPDKEGQMYHVVEDDLYLIPTAEVPVTNVFRDVLLQESELPKTLTAYTPCFRREAGSTGAHDRGLKRLH